MPCCAASDDPQLLEPKPRKNKLKSKLPAQCAPLGVLPVHGPVNPNTQVGLQEVPARGGLAGWQRKRVVEFIEEHLSERISISALANLVQLSSYHFARAFRQTLGMPPHRYHRSRRVARAKMLLAERSVTEVAFAVGYADTSSFSASFRRVTGNSPSGFRNALIPKV